jgi:antitoxin ParD1/3/4
MNIILTPEHANFVQTKLQSGKYTDVEQLLMDAFNLLEERDQDDRWVEEIGVKIDAAAASLDRGEGLDGVIVVNRMLERFRQARMSQG